jgi:hypothetical protein
VPAEAFAHPLASRTLALINLAHDWSPKSPDRIIETNVAAVRVMVASRDACAPGVRIVFASSLSANARALNQYGLCKWEVERTLGPSDVSARIGMVYGDRPSGQYATLSKVVGLTPVLPIIEAHRPVQPIHVSEVARALLVMAALPGPSSRKVRAVAGSPISFSAFLKALARVRHGTSLKVISLPTAPVLTAVSVLARVAPAARSIKERLLGLAGTQVLASEDDMASLGISVVPLPDGLAQDEWLQRRRMLDEARSILTYVGSKAPRRKAMILYARALRVHGGEPLLLPRGQFALRLAEATSQRLAERLDLGMRIDEAMPTSKVGRVRTMAYIAFSLVIEAPFVVLRAVARRR